jgi:hypothetical protein
VKRHVLAMLRTRGFTPQDNRLSNMRLVARRAQDGRRLRPEGLASPVAYHDGA